MGPDAMILDFWMLSFKPTFSLSSFTFIKRLFGSSSLSAIREASSAYLRLLIFLPAILIPAWASSGLAFHMMYCAYKLNKQGDNIQPWHIPFLIRNQSVVPCPVLSVASWPAYRFHRRQVRWSGIPIYLRIFQFIVIHTVKGFGVVHITQSRCFSGTLFSMIQRMLAISSLIPLHFLNPAWTSGSSCLENPMNSAVSSCEQKRPHLDSSERKGVYWKHVFGSLQKNQAWGIVMNQGILGIWRYPNSYLRKVW